LGLKSLSDISFNYPKPQEKYITFDNKQIIKMKAYIYNYDPNYFKVKDGIPVRWEIEDEGASGCTCALIAKGLFSDEILINPGEIVVKEFTPIKPGKYKFSCWMGMVSGIIEVVN